jgi:hypothetical protein
MSRSSSFGPAVSYKSGTEGGNTLLMGDLNGDGKIDYISGSFGKVTAVLNDGSGHFTGRRVSTRDVAAAALADFDRDGKLDIFCLTFGAMEVLRGNGDGTFGEPVRIVTDVYPDPVPARPVATGDFDGDGNLDVVIGSTIYLGGGDGTFRSRTRFRITYVQSIDVADMDGNGSADVVALTPDVAVLLTRTGADPSLRPVITLSSETEEPARFIATVKGDGAVLTGSVLFVVDDRPAAVVPVDRYGVPEFVPQLTAGAHVITATYVGDENYLPSTATVNVAIEKARLRLEITSEENPSIAGRMFRVDVALVPNGPSSVPGLPTGSITLREGNTPLAVVMNGVAFLLLPAGTHVITADYAGDANFESATASYTQEVISVAPSLQIEMTPPSNAVAGKPIVFRTIVTSTATGSIWFYADNVLRGIVPMKNGAAELAMTFVAGTHDVLALYSGDENYRSSRKSIRVTVGTGTSSSPPKRRSTHK